MLSYHEGKQTLSLASCGCVPLFHLSSVSAEDLPERFQRLPATNLEAAGRVQARCTLHQKDQGRGKAQGQKLQRQGHLRIVAACVLPSGYPSSHHPEALEAWHGAKVTSEQLIPACKHPPGAKASLACQSSVHRSPLSGHAGKTTMIVSLLNQ